MAKKKAPTRKERGKKAVKRATTAVKSRKGKPIKKRRPQETEEQMISRAALSGASRVASNLGRAVKSGTTKRKHPNSEMPDVDRIAENMAMRIKKASKKKVSKKKKRGKKAMKQATKAIKARKGKAVKKTKTMKKAK